MMISYRMNHIFFIFAFLSVISVFPFIQAEAASNPNLFVSAENSKFANHFSGSMVIEVVIRDNDIRDTDEGKGEPDVTLNGKSLRMVQATDGNWYAYFANIDRAEAADSTVGLVGEGLDFGSICSVSEGTAAIGIDLSDADGVAYPYDSCAGTFNDSNNVVRKAKAPSNFPNPGEGQIGITGDTWPFIQLFSFSNDVTVQYNPAGEAQRVDLEYDEMPNILLVHDRELYPRNSEVFLNINDFQLNQDPTDEDSWTFNVESNIATFYQAFNSNGQESAAGSTGLVNLIPHLSNLGFEDNGEFSMSLGSVIELKPNDNQNNQISITDGGASTFNQIVTFIEKGPNSGIFESFDHSDQSTIGITPNAPRGETGIITYNQDSVSILTGFTTASLSLDKPELKIESNVESLLPGTEYPIILLDPDQNSNSGSQDDLDVFRDSTLVPTLEIGDPITLEKASNVIFYPNSNNFVSGENVLSSVPDKNSARLFLDAKTNPLSGSAFKQISLNLGVAASKIQSVLIDNDSGNLGTNWLNYDFRSLQNDFEINDFSDTRIDLHFGSFPSSALTIVNPGDITSSQGFIQIDDNIVEDIFNENGSVFLVINFGTATMNILNESNLQPIILDFFSFGLDNSLNGINNSIYRFELEETSDNSSTFEGTLEYAITNQLNILDVNFIKTISTIDDDVKFLITDRSVDEEGVFISYSDLDKVGLSTTVSAKSDIFTHSGVVSTGSTSYRFGQSVVIILNDPDLNLKSDKVDVYSVINDPNSPNVDTVGSNGIKMLEILIKDVRYKRCTINGVEHGGLASTGFNLIETGPSTGIFEGSFSMPSKICNKSGTQLISPAGGSIEIKYFDARDSSGKSNIFSSSNNRQMPSTSSGFISHYPQLNTSEFPLPQSGAVKEVILSGSIDNQKRGIPLSLSLIHPNGKIQEFSASVTNSGNYKTIFTINSSSLPGKYEINLDYAGERIGSVSFNVLGKGIPTWIKDDAKLWSSSVITGSEFIDTIEYLIDEKIISIYSGERSQISERMIPDWTKNNARWWSNNQVSDKEFFDSIQYLIKKGIIKV